MHNQTPAPQPYCEISMENAIKEYDQKLSVSALEIATKYGLPVQDIHTEYAKYKAKGKHDV